METDRERPHRSTSSNSSTSELFVCFTSRLSSSSMKLSSKSILSPSRSRDPPQISLSSSLSRRLRSNGSIKGGGGGGQASPMFPTGGGGKRRGGCGFENPEPSSPKVTCIGQVRVKTKKQGKKMRARSKRRGEASFRKGEQQQQQVGANANANASATNLNPILNPDLTRQSSQGFQHHQNCLKHRNNQRWVHLPLTICEALREFSCFFPCRSSCMSSEKEKEKGGGGGVEGGGHGMMGEGSCGNTNNAVGRWLVALQDGDGKGRGIELVMEEEMEVSGRERSERSHSQRRHVFEDIDVDLVVGEEQEKKHEELVGEEEEKARVSICIPPKNALLLMRCRSDPVKMAALANRFWESPVHKDKCQEEQQQDDEEESGDEEEEQEDDKEQHHKMKDEQQQALEQVEREAIEDSICERETETVVVATENDEEEQDGKESYEIESRENLESKEFTEVVKEEEKVDEEAANGGNAIEGETLTQPEAHSDLENLKTEEKEAKEESKEERENNESSELSSTPETIAASEQENDGAEAETEPVMVETSKGSTEEEEEKVIEPKEQPQQPGPTREQNLDPESKERENGSKHEERDREALPECLLLMMCEPKLSMEVSKETWVCSTDFIRWLPERPAAGGGKRVAGETLAKSKPKPKPKQMMQPPRSSCSFPATRGGAGVSMAAMIEQKLVGSKSGNGYEPFVLTRCKSEPMQSSAKLSPEACFWNNRKLEPHPPATQLGVGAPAGVGF